MYRRPLQLTIAVVALAIAAVACTDSDDTSPTSAPESATAGSEPESSAPTTGELGPSTTAPATTEPQSETTQEPSTTTAAPSTAPLITLPANTNLCAGLDEIEAVGALASPELVEVSGIAASRRHPDVLWVHNDSGGDAAVYAIGTDGELLATHMLDGLFALDWEDMAMGPGPEPGVDYLYVGDIGDNLNFRPDVVVYRFAEPSPASDGTVIDLERLFLVYPEPGVNAEAMAVDPVTGDLFLFAKTKQQPTTIFRAPADALVDDVPTLLEPAGSVAVDEGLEVTAADVSPDGARIVLRGYRSLWVWPRSEPDVATTLAAEPCEAASPREVQGEAATFAPDGSIFTVSEGEGAAVNRVGS